MIAAAVVLGGLTVVSVALLHHAAIRVRPAATRPDVRLVATVVTAWLTLNLATPHRFASRGTEEAVSSLGRDQMLEVAYFAVVGLVAIAVVRQLEPDLRLARPPVPLFALPAWIIASGAWSPIAPYSVVRGVQMIVIAALAWATMLLVGGSRQTLHELLQRYLCWFVRAVLALTALGVVFGPILVPTSGSNLERFTWVGAHPNGSGLLLATAMIIAVTAPLDVLRLRPTGRVLVIVVLGVAMYANQSRGAIASLAAALAVVGFVHLRRNPHRRVLAVPLGSALVATALVGRAQIGAYLLRGGDTGGLADANGRLGLWSDGFRLLQTAFDWMFGLGYGVTRTVFLPGKPWAKSAHNSLLAMLVSVGIVGLVLLLVLVVICVRRALRSGLVADRRVGTAVAGVLVVTLVNGLVSDALAEPKIGLATLYLLIALGSAHRTTAHDGLRYCPPSDGGDEASVVVSGVRGPVLSTRLPFPHHGGGGDPGR